MAGALGVAAFGTYLNQQLTSHVPDVAATFRSTQLAQVQAACVASHGQDIAAIKACVQQAAQQYVQPHAFVLALNDTFLVVTIATGICVALALLVGRDPAVVAARQAAARGERATPPRPAVAGE